MNTNTGELYENDAHIRRMIEVDGVNPNQIVRIPVAYANEVAGMNRKERRKWYRKNRKTLGLERWGTFVVR